MALTFEQFQENPNTEKIALVKLQGSVRLIGWTLHTGSIYKVENFDHAAIVSIKDSGAAYAIGSGAGSLTPSQYFHDRPNRTLYLRASDNSNPNSRFIVLTSTYFMANVPVLAPNDLSTGFDIEWLPMVKSTSSFGVEINTDPEQLGIAVEGDGQLTIHNDKSFWDSRFDKVTFENNICFIYSWSRNIPITEAKLIFRGRVQSRTYAQTEIRFNLKDFLNEMKSKLELGIIGDVSGARVPLTFFQTKLRQIYGEVNGFRPQNINQVTENGYLLVGAVSGDSGDLFRIVGVGAESFRAAFRPNDQIYIEQLGIYKTIISITTNSEMFVSEPFTQAQANELFESDFYVKPNLPKRYTNRVWKLANHEIAEPTAEIINVSGPNLFKVDTVDGFDVGSKIKVGGSNKILTVKSIVGGDKIRVEGTLETVPEIGDLITRRSVTNVKINKELLNDFTGYDYNPADSTLTLTQTAELEITPIRTLSGTLTYHADNTVTGSGTQFRTQLDNNSWIPNPNASFENPTFSQVLSVESDTLLKASPYVLLGDLVQSNVKFKRPSYFSEGTDILTCDIIGATENGLSTGKWIRTAPQVVKDVLAKIDLTASVDVASFTNAEDLAPQRIGMVIPDKFNGRTTISHREIINRVSRSVLGVLVQSPDFTLKYEIIRPNRIDTIKRFADSDILSFNILSDASKLFRKVNLTYNFIEYDPDTRENTESLVESVSKIAEFVAGSDKTFEIEAYLVRDAEAQLIANRWKFLFEVARHTINFRTKMRAARLSANEKIDFSHSFVFEKMGAGKRMILDVVSPKKTASDSTIEVDDLGAALSRCGVWSENGHPNFAASGEGDKLYSGFWTDNYGMIANDPDTHGSHLWW